MRRVVIDNDVTTVAAPAGFIRRDRRRWEALHRRMNRLELRVQEPGYTGDTGRQLAEAAAIRWALKTISEANGTVSTLDLPQSLYVCRTCGKPAIQHAVSRGSITACADEAHHEGGMRIEPTLLYADFALYMERLIAQHGRAVPDLFGVWDRLESCTDTAPSNREAIDNAIRWVVSR